MGVQTRQTLIVADKLRRHYLSFFLFPRKMADDEEAPPEVHHYNDIHEVPWDIQK
jgi:hypothetical protein